MNRAGHGVLWRRRALPAGVGHNRCQGSLRRWGAHLAGEPDSFMCAEVHRMQKPKPGTMEASQGWGCQLPVSDAASSAGVSCARTAQIQFIACFRYNLNIATRPTPIYNSELQPAAHLPGLPPTAELLPSESTRLAALCMHLAVIHLVLVRQRGRARKPSLLS